jgi:hypothetical protein
LRFEDGGAPGLGTLPEVVVFSVASVTLPGLGAGFGLSVIARRRGPARRAVVLVSAGPGIVPAG